MVERVESHRPSPGVAAFAAGDLRAAIVRLERRFKAADGSAWERAVHGHALTLVGRFADAACALDAALDGAGSGGAGPGSAGPGGRGLEITRSWRALLHTLQGNYGDAQLELDAARRAAVGVAPYAEVCAAALARAMGNGGLTLACATEAADALAADRAEPYWLVRALRLQGDGALATGDEPGPHWRAAVELADRSRHPVAQTIAYLGVARDERLGRPERRRSARAAVEVSRRGGYRLGLIDAIEAVEALSAGALEPAVAEAVVTVTTAERRRIGYRVPADPFAVGAGVELDLDAVAAIVCRSAAPAADVDRGDGWARLTVAERRVVELVADGLTNPQIGERLFVSRRTVQSQLSSVFSKVGVGSRSALAAAVVRSGR